ncbi:MAG: hypothetical protein DLM50_09870 [Candidatus Meridianibacter frigidus]|nr:MAG: hypothetical protein DLM50_09870 [Candidatus Eremiobacteraeota bacterium]
MEKTTIPAPSLRSAGQFIVKEILHESIAARTATIGVIGLGYVGLPLAVQLAEHFKVIGVDISSRRIETVNNGRSYIGDVESERVARVVKSGHLQATDDDAALGQCDCVIICVPTPLGPGKQPDISHILNAGRAIANHLRRGQLVILESTTYPGTTDEKLLPLLSERGFELDRDFLLAFSPERIEPGNPDFHVDEIPKVVGGCSADSTEIACELYREVTKEVYPVSSARVAEACKLWENTFRSVNIALANEMAILCQRFGIESSEVIEAATTKPFGFMPFYPGPGVGGHCIPLDPLYLSWKATEHGYIPDLIMVSDQINASMPDYIITLTTDALNNAAPPRGLRGARILIIGVSYKAGVEDTRHSPAISIIDRLRTKGSIVSYHDPYVPHLEIHEHDLPPAPRRDMREIPTERRVKDVESEHTRRRTDPLTSVALTDQILQNSDCVIVVSAHASIDFARIGRCAPLVVDSRNAMPYDLKARIIRL